MAKFLCITPNPAIDLTVTLDELQVGEVNRQQSAQSHAAGKGLNVAQILHDLGHEVWVTGFLGRSNAALFEAHFAAQGFGDYFIRVAGETRTNVKIAEAGGRMTDINGKGFAVSEADKAALLECAGKLAGEVDFIAVSGSLPQQFSPEDLQALVGRLKASNPHIAVDTSGKALAAAAACGPWLLKPNGEELQQAFGLPADTAAEQAAVLAQLPAPVAHVVVSMGEHGVNWWQNNQCLHATAAKVAVKSTVGAGDTLLAGMLHGFASGWPPDQTLRTAAAFAAHAVSQIGFGIPDSTRLQELLQQIHAQIEEGFSS